MDPFGRLPWFVLQDILSNLPDLHSLHKLHNASPAIAAFLHENNDLFAAIVDAVITAQIPPRERGLLPHVQHVVRLLILVWTRASQVKDKAAEVSYADILSNLRYVTERFSLERSIEKTISRSISSAVICRLLALMARLRRVAHACFHSMHARCLKLRVQNLPKGKTKWSRYINARGEVNRSGRPRGIPWIPLDIGPATWTEEQRLFHSLLCVVLSYELRKTHAECWVIAPYGASVHTVLDDNVEGFWRTVFGIHDCFLVEKITTLLAWLDEQAGGRAKLYTWLLTGSIPEEFSHCCSRYTSMTDEQWDRAIHHMYSGRSSRGAQCLWRCDMRGSPVRCVDYSPFRPYGLVFWDRVRLNALGLPGTLNLRAMWFAWSSILTEEDWDELSRRQAVTPG